MQISIPLIDYIAFKMKCDYVSDLKFPLSTIEKRHVLHLLESIPPEAEPLTGWNDALNYILAEAPAQSQAEAKTKLLSGLAA